MISALASPSSASELWYLTRGTGTVALLVLTAVLVLGVMAINEDDARRAVAACPTMALHLDRSMPRATGVRPSPGAVLRW